MEKKRIGKVMVEIEDEFVDITDLPKEQYEYFLELMHILRVAYITVARDKGKS